MSQKEEPAGAAVPEPKAGTKITEKQWPAWIAAFWLPFVAVISECCFAAMIGSPITLNMLLLSVSMLLLISLLILLIPKKRFRVIATGILTILLAVIYIAQFIYYRIFSTIFVWASLQGTGDALAEYNGVMFSAIAKGWWGLLILLLPSVFYWVMGRKFVRAIPTEQKRFVLVVAGAFVSVSVLGTGLVLNNRKGAASPRRLYLTEFSQEASLREFGLLPTMGLDFRYNVLNISWQEKSNVDISDIVIETVAPTETTAAPTFTPTPVPPTKAPEATPSPTPTPSPSPTPYPKNVLDIDFNLEEDDKVYRHMNEFFSQREPTTMNEYTGRFKGKNLILITAEAFSGFVIDPELTPTLYKLSTTGFVFNNFYTPEWYVSTSDGEFVETTGLIPKSGVWSYTKIAKNYMPFAFGNQFHALGYQTFAYHNNTYTYYNRDRSYPVMGYTYRGLGNGLNVTKQWPESDVEMIEDTVSEYLNGQPFHVYYMTVSGHLPYAFGDNKMSSKHRDRVKDLDYSSGVKAYIACQIELDEALKLLLEELEAAGELENTVIALGADHNPYGLTASEYRELAGKKVSYPFSYFENAFILWCGDMEEPVVIDKYCCSMDIAPTLANLFGLPYDSRLYIGTDILAPEPNYVIFDDKSFINDKIMYDAGSRKVTMLVDEEITDEYLKSCIEYVDELFYNSAHIIDKNYYGYLFPDGVPWEQEG